MQSVFFRGAAVFSIVVISACGGGGGSSSKPATAKPAITTPTTSKPTASYSTLVGEAGDIVEKYNFRNPYLIDVTNNYQMPTSGKATYRGTGFYSPNLTPSTQPTALAGRAVLQADFKASKLTGKVTDFKASPGHRTTGGSLNIDTDIVTAYTEGQVTGNLNLDGRNIKIDEEVLGSFYGDNADAVAILSRDAITSGSNPDIAIVAEK